MNNNSEDQIDISNENLKACPDKKLHHFDQEWANYANNPSPHFTPSQFFNAPHTNLPPLNLEKSSQFPYIKVMMMTKTNKVRKSLSKIFCS
ncbi:unnamed protein product (macronuclear) [Paramecium tetraurelia]|uniref:Uncharacterized protein n=1 Tax=Paramecium tetraurelia TaxID=5888 RepID=A0DS03_PARTE|nr:uncharacterized protein GSPATT00019524001 [Paramecium tetraurelia]CAK85820.1 unnamed protein product [Paramecium tetraurelia]|eukprot:XP_001453217.1 hypothetical protein (macronuclear) [Paramecium tetraurelia strain d4-2]